MSPLFYRIMADIVVCVHLLFVSFVGFGLILIIIGGVRGWDWVRSPAFRIAHLTAIAIVVGLSWFDIECPLTSLEKWSRTQAGEVTYTGGFIARWVHDLLFIDLPTWAFTLIYTAFGAAVVASFWLVPPTRRRSERLADGSESE